MREIGPSGSASCARRREGLCEVQGGSEEYLTWILFVFKLDIFKNNRRFYFILKDLLLK
jgi:hypothetical protein